MVYTQRYLRLILITGLLLLFNIVRADPIPNLTAQAWLVADESGKILEGTHTDEVRSTASITKLLLIRSPFDVVTHNVPSSIRTIMAIVNIMIAPIV